MALPEAGIVPGQVYRLSPLVRRITAPNGGRMTGAGTNSYLVGNSEIAVIDPGPAIDSHVDAILAEGAGRIRWVLVTHTHADHSPAARAIIAATGARPLGCLLHPDDGHQDNSFQVERDLVHGEVLGGDGFHLEAIFTPGHIGNHFCFLLREEGLLFAGDHIMEGVSVVIVPPSGDLKDFLDSLERLKGYPISAIAPAHGEIIGEPWRELDKLVKHRHYREQKVITAMTRLGEASLDELLPVAYDDVDPALHKVARWSLWAHLLKLEREGRALKTIASHWAFGEERWRLDDARP
ncbi:MAG: MBL fold metallo-hydrolase [Porticoccaceae bacterium]|jgi:glyoxylase-like metal-dependent hydrolase (beta-lactamase superfamily II)|nr:MBL fold metallo-hydrolase [Porticoccaceae bacterium]MEA3301094.1 MBL fold metallo-hydrolase [Pseudomonadota bacterium]HLS98158.1 MBL fold metallo-hydrolase [Porticoccaceae bacterium]